MMRFTQVADEVPNLRKSATTINSQSIQVRVCHISNLRFNGQCTTMELALLYFAILSTDVIVDNKQKSSADSHSSTDYEHQHIQRVCRVQWLPSDAAIRRQAKKLTIITGCVGWNDVKRNVR
jgi:hypothetical protein